jgi:hypothetical protein
MRQECAQECDGELWSFFLCRRQDKEGAVKRTGICLGLAVLAAAGGCGSADSEHAGYVLLDQEARQAGLSLEVGDHAVASPLPVEVATESSVALVGTYRHDPLTVGKGELVYIQGAAGHVSHLQLGKDVAIDQLRLEGEESAARELALQLGGRVSEEGGGWRLTQHEVFLATGTTQAPARLLGAAPILLHVGPGAQTPATGVALATQGVVQTPAVLAVVPAAPVLLQPIEPASGVRPVPPVAFTAAEGCSGVTGTWRGRVYSDRHGGYYDFTLAVRHGSAGPSSLSGTVVAETWVAPTEQVNPPTTCAGDLHHTVIESATGSVDAAGTMRLDSKSWRLGRVLCGPKTTDYSPDKFQVPQADGAATSHAVVSDDQVWSDGLGIDLTRVSCR